jgi:hypothetical protein
MSEARLADEVVAALLSLFRALQEEEAAPPTQEPAPGCALRQRRVVTPSALREALSALPGQGFQIGALQLPAAYLPQRKSPGVCLVLLAWLMKATLGRPNISG